MCAADLLTRGTEVAPFVNFRVHLLAQSLKNSETRRTKTRSKHVILFVKLPKRQLNKLNDEKHSFQPFMCLAQS